MCYDYNIMQMLSWAEFLSLINARDIKLCGVPRISTSQDITKKAIELANGEGGYLVLGFDRYTFQLYGCVFDSKWLNAILAQEIRPALNYEIMGFIRSNKRIFVVKIAEGTAKPYQALDGSDVKTAAPIKLSPEEAPEFVQKRQAVCLEYLKTNDGITNMQYRELNSVSYKTAHNELSALVEKKNLAQVGQGRTTKYVLAEKAAQYTQAEAHQSLFGDTLDTLVSLNSATVSVTDFRRAEMGEHMDEHLTKLD
ncbi:hypothetical protein NO2_0535 [Candidatus Termititenax persephonae]|uniref:Schlafen AlbA-2 domain-containing protein n=1 Tax=Candidatus Termititenax persephonae TaxID=2218525 RepID=A0A388TGJ8_9BACT|nr:hypothetical protein NO2_0535 [Candidatus Termititenax persephonae]